ncbi:hypothetical protein Trydic_g59 [Trypoxylus dichotomus]
MLGIPSRYSPYSPNLDVLAVRARACSSAKPPCTRRFCPKYRCVVRTPSIFFLARRFVSTISLRRTNNCAIDQKARRNPIRTDVMDVLRHFNVRRVPYGGKNDFASLVEY